MNWKKEWKPLTLIAAVFLAFYYFPVEQLEFDNAVTKSIALARWYAREHILLCLIPAFYIAGAIAILVSQASVMKYLGAKANKVLAYGVASVPGTILAVCSCTILPLFAGIYRMGAGLGPATAFLYSGPALSLPNMLVIRSVIGTLKTVVYVLLVIVMATITGLAYGMWFRRRFQMKQIRVLGTGCAKCNKLEEAAIAAADEMGIEYEFEKVTDIMKNHQLRCDDNPGVGGRRRRQGGQEGALERRNQRDVEIDRRVRIAARQEGQSDKDRTTSSPDSFRTGGRGLFGDRKV